MNKEEIDSLESGTLCRAKRELNIWVAGTTLSKTGFPRRIFLTDIFMILEKPIYTETKFYSTFYTIKCLYRNVVGYCFVTSYDDFEVISC